MAPSTRALGSCRSAWLGSSAHRISVTRLTRSSLQEISVGYGYPARHDTLLERLRKGFWTSSPGEPKINFWYRYRYRYVSRAVRVSGQITPHPSTAPSSEAATVPGYPVLVRVCRKKHLRAGYRIPGTSEAAAQFPKRYQYRMTYRSQRARSTTHANHHPQKSCMFLQPVATGPLPLTLRASWAEVVTWKSNPTSKSESNLHSTSNTGCKSCLVIRTYLPFRPEPRRTPNHACVLSSPASSNRYGH